MPHICRQKNKKSGTVYVYEVDTYWDPERHMTRSHRRLIGKEDPVTGEVVPTRKRGRPSKDPEQQADGVAGTDAAETPEEEEKRRRDMEQRRRNAARHLQDEETIKELRMEVSKLKLQLKMIKTSFDALMVQFQECYRRLDEALKGI